MKNPHIEDSVLFDNLKSDFYTIGHDQAMHYFNAWERNAKKGDKIDDMIWFIGHEHIKTSNFKNEYKEESIVPLNLAIKPK